MDARAPAKDWNIIFVLDDDLAVRESLKFALELEGLEVLACAGTAELSAHPRLAEASCLVIDPNLPTLNEGFEMLERLAARGIKPPVIVITSRVTNGLRQRSRLFGVDRILEKPLFDRTLVEAIKAMIGNGQGHADPPA